ncbi:hypothetical protein IWQ60_000654 [Tieghemiomyces parasiticus]|uniref:C2H2-type domain-containing protein n=1 Tax=Tieghemiomyces parasiticus TaxID=78921 RepID=A0A9W8ALB7_9FUNG|nr:hypothetical protein IWQ60_000654 [Tieghemiomyces parasiticus]
MSDDPLPMVCSWTGCDLPPFMDSIALYDHITQEHIGRKASNNLCLECRWEGCHFQAKKRDHITSHMRSHIDYRPHLCAVCRKSFKRPQDLKKHERIHNDALSNATLSPDPGALSPPAYYGYYSAGSSSPPVLNPYASVTHLAAPSPHALPDSPSSLANFTHEYSPDHTAVAGTSGNPSYAGSDLSDGEHSSTTTAPRGRKRSRGLDDLLDSDNQVKLQALYNQEAQQALERLIQQNMGGATTFDTASNLSVEGLQNLYRFFQEIYDGAASVNVSEALNASDTPVDSAYPVAEEPSIDFDSVLTSAADITQALAGAPAPLPTAGFDITVQPFDETSYLPAYPNLAFSAGLPAGGASQPTISPGMFAGGFPTSLSPSFLAGTAPTDFNMTTLSGTIPQVSLAGQPMMTPKGFVPQAVPVAHLAHTQVPAYQTYTLQPQMKARDDSPDPEVVNHVFDEVIDGNQVDAENLPSLPEPLPTPSPLMTLATLSTDSVPARSPSLSPALEREAGEGTLARSPLSAASAPRSPCALSPRRVESVSVCSPSAKSSQSEPTLEGATVTTRSFMYPGRPYTRKISMTDGQEDDYVDISVQTNRAIGRATRAAPVTPTAPANAPTAVASTPADMRERHAQFAASLLAQIWEALQQHRDQRRSRSDVRTDDEPDYVKLEHTDLPYVDVSSRSGASAGSAARARSPLASTAIKAGDDLVARFRKLGVSGGAPLSSVHPRSPATTEPNKPIAGSPAPFDLTVAPTEIDA